LGANRDARCGQRRRALFTLAVRLTPFAGALQSFPRSVVADTDHKLARGAVGRRQDFCLWNESIFAGRDFLAGTSPGEGRLKSTDI
jgi:hypothetical protein